MQSNIPYRSSIFMLAFFLGFIGLWTIFGSIFGFKVWHKYYGWVEPSYYGGLFFILFSLLFYVYAKYYLVEPRVLKCLECDEVFCETDIKNEMCPKCSKKLIDIKELYK